MRKHGIIKVSRKLDRFERRNNKKIARYNRLTNLNATIQDKIDKSNDEYITVVHHGDYSNTQRWLNSLLDMDYLNVLESYGQKGVELLREATPIDTGLTAASWTYDIVRDSKGNIKVVWYNTNEVETASGYKFNVALLLQTGHATRNGGWVEGIDYINPTLKPLFDELAEAASEEIRRK